MFIFVYCYFIHGRKFNSTYTTLRVLTNEEALHLLLFQPLFFSCLSRHAWLFLERRAPREALPNGHELLGNELPHRDPEQAPGHVARAAGRPAAADGEQPRSQAGVDCDLAYRGRSGAAGAQDTGLLKRERRWVLFLPMHPRRRRQTLISGALFLFDLFFWCMHVTLLASLVISLKKNVFCKKKLEVGQIWLLRRWCQEWT